MSWDCQVNQLVSKLSRAIGTMRHHCNYLPTSINMLLYNSMFFSLVQYGILVWGTTSAENMHKLTVLKKKKTIRLDSQAPYEYGEVCAVRVGSVVVVCVYIAPVISETAAADLIAREPQSWIRKDAVLVVRDFNQNVRVSTIFSETLHVRAGLEMASPTNAILTNRNTCLDLTFHNQDTVKEVKYCSCNFMEHKAMLLAVGEKKPVEEHQVEQEEE